MGAKYEFHRPTCNDQTVTPGTTPVTLASLLTNKAGVAGFDVGVTYV